MNLFSLKKKKEELKPIAKFKTIERPSNDEVLDPLSKKIPDYIRIIDNQLVLDIMDRLLGPSGIQYEKKLIELNKEFEARKGKSGNQFYDPKSTDGLNISKTVFNN